MIMVPVDPKSIMVRECRRAYRKVQRAVEEFINSPHAAVELQWEPGEYASVASVSSTYTKAIRSLQANCFVVIRDGRAYLIRKEIDHD